MQQKGKQAMVKQVFGGFLGMVAVACSGAASAQTAPLPAPAPAPAVATTQEQGYILGPGDVIEIAVLGRDEFRPRVQVQVDGTVQLPFIGNLTATNKTVLQLRDEVRDKLKAGGYYANPAVNVSVASYASRYVIVLGEVGQPGIVPIDRAYRVSEILARAGGTKAPGVDSITLTRKTGETLNLSISEAATNGGDKDPAVNAGDKLYVAPAKTFYIYGQVAAPGTYPVDRAMDLRKALARSGGLTKMGSESRVKVIRKGVEIKKFNPSDPIVDGDVVVVGERFF
jgi:polysaccharide export outer membrane protein